MPALSQNTVSTYTIEERIATEIAKQLINVMPMQTKVGITDPAEQAMVDAMNTQVIDELTDLAVATAVALVSKLP